MAAPDEAVLWYELGMTHSRRKEWERALEALNRAAELDPDNRRYNLTLGHCLSRAGAYDQDFACFRKTLGEAQAHYRVARMMHHMKQYDLSRQQLQLHRWCQWLSEHHPGGVALHLLARAAFVVGDRRVLLRNLCVVVGCACASPGGSGRDGVGNRIAWAYLDRRLRGGRRCGGLKGLRGARGSNKVDLSSDVIAKGSRS